METYDTSEAVLSIVAISVYSFLQDPLQVLLLLTLFYRKKETESQCS